MQYPKISIIIVNFNLGEYLEECIQSVISQGYPNLELILIDGGSTDNSVGVIEKYASYFTYWVSEPDEGQYYGIQKGFEKSTGEIMAYLNSDDKYLTKSLFAVAEIFQKFPEVSWLMGLAREYTETGYLVGRITLPWCRWSKWRYLTGDFQFIQQESSFWRRQLWEKSGSCLDTNVKQAADMELWSRFFRHEKLYTTVLELSGFRHRKENQRSKDFRSEYLKECIDIIKRERSRLTIREKFLLPWMQLVRWTFGILFFMDFPLVKLVYPKIFGIPKAINFDFGSHELKKDNTLVKHPPLMLFSKQVHSKMFED